MHLETDKVRLLKEIQTSRIEINNCQKRIGKYYIICRIIAFTHYIYLTYIALQSIRLNNSFILFQKKLGWI